MKNSPTASLSLSLDAHFHVQQSYNRIRPRSENPQLAPKIPNPHNQFTPSGGQARTRFHTGCQSPSTTRSRKAKNKARPFPPMREGVTRRRMLLLPMLLLRNTCDDDDSDDAMLVPRHNPTTKLRFWDPPPTLLLPKQIAPSPYTQGTIYKSGRVHATATSPTETQQRSSHPKMRAPAATTDACDSPDGGPPISLPPSTFTDTQKPRTRASENPRAQCRSSYERRPARKPRARP